MIAPTDITGLVLAGGRGSRMGGADKGLLPLAGRPLAWHALERLRPQVGPLEISANRHLDAYQALGVPVWPDALAFEGPLAGLLAGLTACKTDWLLAVPCDAPFFPADLALRLTAGLEAAPTPAGQGCRSSHVAQALQPQPLFCLLHRSLRDELARFVEAGGRRAQDWARQAQAVRVDFDRPDVDARAFLNLNRPADLAAAEADLARAAQGPHHR